MVNGVAPCVRDHRDYSCNATFGVSTIPFADELNFDAGFGMPDQNADGHPQGCTGYAQTETCQDEDRVEYDPQYTYDKTLFMEGKTKEGDPCQVRNSLKSTILWGVRPKTTPLHAAAITFVQAEDAEAAKHKRGAYYYIELNTGMDWFDSLRNMLLAGNAVEYDTGRHANRSISIASPWYMEWTGLWVNSTGIVPTPGYWGASTGDNWRGHNWKICGWKTIDGVPYLIGKTWQGKDFGDKGWAYFSREIINTLMTIEGSGAFIPFRANPVNKEDVKLVTLTWLDWFNSVVRWLQTRL